MIPNKVLKRPPQATRRTGTKHQVRQKPQMKMMMKMTFFADGGGNQNETKKAFKSLNKDSLEIYISKPISDGSDESKVHYVVIFGLFLYIFFGRTNRK